MASDRLNLLLTDFERVLVRLDEALRAKLPGFLLEFRRIAAQIRKRAV
jgi:hypothetical protein